MSFCCESMTISLRHIAISNDASIVISYALHIRSTTVGIFSYVSQQIAGCTFLNPSSCDSTEQWTLFMRCIRLYIVAKYPFAIATQHSPTTWHRLQMTPKVVNTWLRFREKWASIQHCTCRQSTVGICSRWWSDLVRQRDIVQCGQGVFGECSTCMPRAAGVCDDVHKTKPHADQFLLVVNVEDLWSIVSWGREQVQLPLTAFDCRASIL